MRILGIDCGSERTGYGVIESDGRRHCYLAAGVIKVSPRQAFSERLHAIAGGLRKVIASQSPECVAVEGVFHAVNAQSALKLAHVRGVAMLVGAEAGLQVAEYTPLEIKMSVVGYGRAEKEQVQLMVCSLLHLERIVESKDASDALAAAICHATHAHFQQRVAAR